MTKVTGVSSASSATSSRPGGLGSTLSSLNFWRRPLEGDKIPEYWGSMATPGHSLNV